jgi:hypothetical protein
MSLMKGRHLDDFLAQRHHRDFGINWATICSSCSISSASKLEALHADPHWEIICSRMTQGFH